MGRSLPPLLFAIVFLSLGIEQGIAYQPPADAPPPVVLPLGSKVEMALTIPAGTYVAGTIDSIVPPTRKVARAEIDVHFDQIIFADGYTVAIPDADQPGAPAAGPGATLSMVTVQVSRNNDILLDNGSQIEMTLEAPLALDAAKVA